MDDLRTSTGLLNQSDAARFLGIPQLARRSGLLLQRKGRVPSARRRWSVTWAGCP
ncbi:hypothetical protein [Microbispora sp. NBC_01389]|uniref:hypothetical protein n=1 Tax=Microbispora sp. NBC_01389 TaxID=2903584 RepID=UPI003247BAAA